MDGYSKRIFIELHKSPAEFAEYWENFVTKIEAQQGKSNVVSQLITDCAPYFEKNNRLQAFCKRKGIIQLYSPPYTQALNGLAERTIRTLTEMMRSMMIQAGVPKCLYGEAYMYASYILNRLPYKAGADYSRMERWLKRKINNPTKNIRVFGSAVWIHDVFETGPGNDKLDSKCKKGTFILTGINEDKRTYRCALLPHLKIIESGHVTFNEDEFPCKEGKPVTTSTSDILHDNTITPAGTGATADARRSTRTRQPSAAALRNIPDKDTPPDVQIEAEDAEALAAMERVYIATA